MRDSIEPSERPVLLGRAGLRACYASIALAVAVGLVAPSARADDRTEARRHFKAGMELVKKGRYDDAVRELETANAILPHPNVTFNIAQALAKAGKIERAIAAYREYLASDPPDRADVVTVVADLQKQIDSRSKTESGREHFRAGMALIAKSQYDEGIKELEREILRKDKALAEASALLILQKK